VRDTSKTASTLKSAEIIWTFNKRLFREFIIVGGVVYVSVPLLVRTSAKQFTMVVLDRTGKIKRLRIEERNKRLHFHGKALPFEYRPEARRIIIGSAAASFSKPKVLPDGRIAVRDVFSYWASCCRLCKAVHRVLGLSDVDGICCDGNC